MKDNGENLAEKYHKTTNIGKHCKENWSKYVGIVN